MCGRYTIKTDRRIIEERFGLDELPAFAPRYNLAPTQDGLVLRPGQRPGQRVAAWLRWGLIPAWTKNPAAQPLLINARSETAASRPAFRESLRRRRCLVVADGFYEWARDGVHAKQPFHFTVDHGAPFAMAGLWERWSRPAGSAAEPAEAVETFAILTTSANEVLAPYHDRMPVILDARFYDDWLNPFLTDTDTVHRLLLPFPSMRMVARAVGPRVNSNRFDDPACLDPPGRADTEEGRGGPPAARPPGQLDLDLGG
jgi:putative SOS response-associated peptidase YedK